MIGRFDNFHHNIGLTPLAALRACVAGGIYGVKFSERVEIVKATVFGMLILALTMQKLNELRGRVVGGEAIRDVIPKKLQIVAVISLIGQITGECLALRGGIFDKVMPVVGMFNFYFFICLTTLYTISHYRPGQLQAADLEAIHDIDVLEIGRDIGGDIGAVVWEHLNEARRPVIQQFPLKNLIELK